MKAAVYNLKGGVGKTRIAAAIALSLKWGIVTNDAYSIIHEVFPEKCLILEKMTRCQNFQIILIWYLISAGMQIIEPFQH